MPASTASDSSSCPLRGEWTYDGVRATRSDHYHCAVRPRSMARRATLTHEALLALGLDKLAKLVVDEASRNAGFKRIVNAALAGARGPDAVAAIVTRRLTALQKARGFIDWEKRKAFVADLRATLATITDELGAADSSLAAEQGLRFLATAERVFERVDDSSGQVQQVYWDAAEAIPALVRNHSDPEKARLPDRLMPLLHEDDQGLIESVLEGVVPLLPSAAIERLDGALAAAAQEIGPPKADERAWERQGRLDRMIRARQALADQHADGGAFIPPETSRPPPGQGAGGDAKSPLSCG